MSSTDYVSELNLSAWMFAEVFAIDSFKTSLANATRKSNGFNFSLPLKGYFWQFTVTKRSARAVGTQNGNRSRRGE